jgi:hypothetical protein
MVHYNNLSNCFSFNWLLSYLNDTLAPTLVDRRSLYSIPVSEVHSRIDILFDSDTVLTSIAL